VPNQVFSCSPLGKVSRPNTAVPTGVRNFLKLRSCPFDGEILKLWPSWIQICGGW